MTGGIAAIFRAVTILEKALQLVPMGFKEAQRSQLERLPPSERNRTQYEQEQESGINTRTIMGHRLFRVPSL